MFNVGPMELLVILLVALIVVGPAKLPEIGKTIGRALSELRRTQDEFRNTLDFGLGADEPAPAAPTTPSPEAEPPPPIDTSIGPPESPPEGRADTLDDARPDPKIEPEPNQPGTPGEAPAV